MKYGDLLKVFKQSNVILGAILVASLLVLALPLAITTPANAQDKHVVNIFSNNQKKSFVTDAATVGEALERAGIIVEQNDLVEPAVSEEINSDSFNINVYRARMITVVDKGKTYPVLTAFRSPNLIAEAAGLEVYPEDEFEFSRVENIVAEGLVGQKLIIDRALLVNLNLYGSAVEARTQSSDVASFLEEKGILVEARDQLTPDAAASIAQGMTVSVTRVGTEVVAVEETVDYGREVINDTSIPVGIEEVKTPGVDGLAMVTYEVTYHNNEEVSRVRIQSITLEEAIDEVVVIGAKAVDISGNKLDWMEAAGIAQSDWPYVDHILTKESHWGVTTWNGLGSGAYGICQALPASKMASAGADYMTNPVTQLKWCNGYAEGRYGSWASAYNFWQQNSWW